MRTEASSKRLPGAGLLHDQPIVETSVSSPNGRAKVTVRVSVEANQVGFKGTALEGGWVTIEASEELPHAPTEIATADAIQTCRGISIGALDPTLEQLLANVSVPEQDRDLLTEILKNPRRAVEAGAPEAWVRAFEAAPTRVWHSLTEQEQKELRVTYGSK